MLPDHDIRVCQELALNGASQSVFEPALFYWQDKGTLHGVVASHVDDFIFAGNSLFRKKVIEPIKELFNPIKPGLFRAP